MRLHARTQRRGNLNASHTLHSGRTSLLWPRTRMFIKRLTSHRCLFAHTHTHIQPAEISRAARAVRIALLCAAKPRGRPRGHISHKQSFCLCRARCVCYVCVLCGPLSHFKLLMTNEFKSTTISGKTVSETIVLRFASVPRNWERNVRLRTNTHTYYANVAAAPKSDRARERRERGKYVN